MNTKQMIAAALVVAAGNALANTATLDIAFVDSFKAMRECQEGEKVGKELEALREKISKEIQEQAKKLAAEENDLKAKAATLKKDVLDKRSRDLEKKRRDLEAQIQDAEEELKTAMNEKTAVLAAKVEEGIVTVAKSKGVDAVIDKMTGRVMYTKDGNKGDLTADTIAHVNKAIGGDATKSATQVASRKDGQASRAA